jgi:ATP-dependent protease ClpP protease subunit
MSDEKRDEIKEYGTTGHNGIQVISIIGEIEGHDCLPENTKTTKYEHLLPMLVRMEQEESIKGILFLIHTVGGDVSCGLALAEMIASLSKPTVSLVIGDSHSIGVPLAVSTDYSFIVPSATMIIHPVRMNGMVLGTPQTYSQFQQIQDRILNFIASHSRTDTKKLEEWMMNTSMLSKDLGTVLVGKDAVAAGLIQELGGISRALVKLEQMIGQA